ncbi:MAG: molecular chaperone HtpG [Oscillospiraceae bacterium]|nr:molecular chaperone HtpG [Oscillospiraceae bacterium]
MAKKQFKAESKRLLELMIDSIYTNKDIFLREMISNASDAEDKLCYMALTDDTIGMSRDDFYIRIDIDKENRLLTVSDNGVGMSKEELESNLGTIARSGSLKFRDGMEKKEDIDIIGQFGVGFYSAFMVSDKVTVMSKRYDSQEAWCWTSSGVDGYQVSECEKDGHGTSVVMHIKEDTEDDNFGQYLEQYTIQTLVRRYSDYIRYPIKLLMKRTRRVEGENDEKPRYEDYTEDVTLNSMVPIWQRNKGEVPKEDYDSFYSEKFLRPDKPLRVITMNAEGLVSFRALLYVPGEVPYDYYTTEYKRGLQLYSSGVLIMDSCEELLPEHFRFVKGVVDTQDVSLNISRETLQKSRQVKVIAGNIEKRIRSELKKMMDEDRENYEKFFRCFGLQLKYGILASYGAASEDLKDLLMYHSSTQGGLVTLREYVSRMPEDQKYIYYASGDDTARIDRLPQTEVIKQRGMEMLYLTDSVDEFVIQTLREYDNRQFKSVNDDDGLVGDEEKEKVKQKNEKHKQLLDFVGKALEGKIKEARISGQLVSQPVCLTAEGGISFEMEKYLKTVARDEESAGQIKAQRILQLNPEHEVFAKLEAAVNEDPDRAEKLCRVLYGQACLMADLPLEDPAEFSQLVSSLIF